MIPVADLDTYKSHNYEFPPSQAPPQPRPRINFNPEKSLSAKLFGIDFGNAFGRPFRRGSGVTPLRGYFKTSAGIFAAGHFAKPWGRVFVTTIFAVAGTRDSPEFRVIAF